MGCQCARVAPLQTLVRVVTESLANGAKDNDENSTTQRPSSPDSTAESDNRSFEIEMPDEDAFNKSFIRKRQQAIDNNEYRSNIDSWKPTSLAQLVDYVKSLSNNKSVIDCHWIIFYWIATNIEYDVASFFTNNYADQTSEGVFRTKKGVCAGYANIYQHLCDALNLPCEKVSGYSKGYRFHNRQGVLKDPDHAWNAVEIDHHWYLMESTWGAGHLTEKKLFQRKLDTYYFLPRPNEMIYHHLPENDKWQLLKSPITLKQYLQMPNLRPLYFELNLDLISPRYQAHVDLLPGKSYAEILIRTSSDVKLTCDLQINDQKIEGGDQVEFYPKRKMYCCRFAPNAIGKHKVTIYAKKGDHTDTYTDALYFDLTVKDKLKSPISFPKTWPLFYEFGLQIESPRNRSSAIWPEKASFAEIRLSAPDDIDFICETKFDGIKKENCALAQFDQDKQQWQFLFAPQNTGLHRLLIYARHQSDSKKSFGAVVEFDLNVTKLWKTITFPLTYGKFQSEKCRIYTPLDGLLKRDALVPVHCIIPGAYEVDVQVDSKWIDAKGYKDPVFKTKVRAGWKDVTICAKYDEKSDYDGLVRYSVQ